MPIAFCACSAAISAEKSRSVPCVPGYWKIAPNTSAGPVLGRAHDHLDLQRRGAGLHHGDVLRVAVLIHEERARLRLRHALRHGHRLGRRRRLVQKRGIGDLQPGQIADHGLEVQQRLQPALADLGLVGRVGGVPGGVLEHIALDRRRRHRVVIALPDQRGQHGCSCRPPRACDAAIRSPTSACRNRAARPAGWILAPSRRSARRGFRRPEHLEHFRISSGEGPIWRRLAKSYGR